MAQFCTQWHWRRLGLGLAAGAAATYTWAWAPLIGVVTFVSLPLAVSMYVVSEVVFWAAQRAKHKALCSLPKGTTLSADSPKRAWATLHQVLSSMEELQFSCATWLGIWFKGAQPQDICRENVADMLASALWCSNTSAVRAAGFGHELDAMVSQLEAVCVQQAGLSAAPDATDAGAAPSAAGAGVLPRTGSVFMPATPAAADFKRLSSHVVDPLMSVSDFNSSESESSVGDGEELSRPESCNNLAWPVPEHASGLSAAAAALPAGPAMPQPILNTLPACGTQPDATFFPPGRNPHLEFFDHQPTPLPHWYRPLLVYLAFEFMGWMNHNMLTWSGFTRHVLGGFEYYTYGMPPLSTGTSKQGQRPQAAPAKKPLLFLHGVGMGLLPYIKVLLSLASTGAPIIALEYKHVGQRWCSHVPSMHELLAVVLGMVDRHACGVDNGGVHVVAHSFGSALAAMLLKAQPQLVNSLSLMDPICFHMWVPSLLVNFIYRPLAIASPPTSAHPLATLPAPAGTAPTPAPPTSSPAPKGLLAGLRAWADWVPIVMKDFFIIGPAREMHCSAALCRLLDWRDTSLWAAQLPPSNKCIIALAGCDELLPAPLIARWACTHTQAKVVLAPRLRHAEMLVYGSVLDPLVADIYEMAYGTDTGSTATAPAAPPPFAAPAPAPTAAPEVSVDIHADQQQQQQQQVGMAQDDVGAEPFTTVPLTAGPGSAVRPSTLLGAAPLPLPLTLPPGLQRPATRAARASLEGLWPGSHRPHLAGPLCGGAPPGVSAPVPGDVLHGQQGVHTGRLSVDGALALAASRWTALNAATCMPCAVQPGSPPTATTQPLWVGTSVLGSLGQAGLLQPAGKAAAAKLGAYCMPGALPGYYCPAAFNAALASPQAADPAAAMLPVLCLVPDAQLPAAAGEEQQLASCSSSVSSDAGMPVPVSSSGTLLHEVAAWGAAAAPTLPGLTQVVAP